MVYMVTGECAASQDCRVHFAGFLFRPLLLPSSPVSVTNYNGEDGGGGGDGDSHGHGWLE